jgi:hypothetical protein
MESTNYRIKEVHISEIKSGDTILHVDGHIRTVSSSNIKRGFSGITLFGDPYIMGRKLVKKIIYERQTTSRPSEESANMQTSIKNRY